MDLNYTLRAKKFKAKKNLGQNFLVSSEIVDFIAGFANNEDEILEIGPGLGFVTERLVRTAKKVTAVELDEDAVKVLEKNLSSFDNFELIKGDILKFNIDNLPFTKEKIKIIANIPYYITSPILVHLLGEIDELEHKNRKRISEIILMVQYEVARRIIANESSPNKEFGQLSILSSMFCDVEIIKKVPKTAFLPSPKVDSAIVKFKINDKSKCEITKHLKRVIKAIFTSRRKNIKNSLQNSGFINVESALEKAGVDKNERGEKLSIFQMQKIALALEEFN